MREGLEVRTLPKHEPDDAKQRERQHVGASQLAHVWKKEEYENRRGPIDSRRRECRWIDTRVDDKARDHAIARRKCRRGGNQDIAQQWKRALLGRRCCCHEGHGSAPTRD